MKDVPDPSERCTTTTSVAGSLTPGFTAAIRASLHFVIFPRKMSARTSGVNRRSEEHTSELQSRLHLVCRLLLEKKKINVMKAYTTRIDDEPLPTENFKISDLHHQMRIEFC